MVGLVVVEVGMANRLANNLVEWATGFFGWALVGCVVVVLVHILDHLVYFHHKVVVWVVLAQALVALCLSLWPT